MAKSQVKGSKPLFQKWCNRIGGFVLLHHSCTKLRKKKPLAVNCVPILGRLK